MAHSRENSNSAAPSLSLANRSDGTFAAETSGRGAAAAS
jgi:hypothetical protein